MTKKTARLLLFLMLPFVPISADARGSSDISAAPPASEERQAPPIRTELEKFGRATVSAREGITAVEEHLAGAKVVDISFDGQAKAPVYHVKAYRNGKIWNGAVDASTRNIVGGGNLMSASKLDFEDESNITDLKREGLDLSEAVAVAEKYGSGKAISAGLSRADGKLIFLVVVVSDGALKEISVDPTGEKRHWRRPSGTLLQRQGAMLPDEERA